MRTDKPKLKPTDISEKTLAMAAEVLGVSTVELVDGLQIEGDNIFFPTSQGRAWIWSRGDEDEDDEDEAA